MIKINLLPVRQYKKRANAKKQIFLILICFLCFGCLLGGITYVQLQKVKNLDSSIARIEKEKKQYAPILAKIKKIQATKKELERKTAIIDKLKRDSSLTVRVLDEVANTIDNERMWLLSLNQQGGSLQLSGVALDNQTVAQFMDNLELSPYVGSVDLTDSSLKKVAGKDLKSFSLRCSVSHPVQPKQQVAQVEKK